MHEHDEKHKFHVTALEKKATLGELGVDEMMLKSAIVIESCLQTRNGFFWLKIGCNGGKLLALWMHKRCSKARRLGRFATRGRSNNKDI
jgi:hypothetical protein